MEMVANVFLLMTLPYESWVLIPSEPTPLGTSVASVHTCVVLRSSGGLHEPWLSYSVFFIG